MKMYIPIQPFSDVKVVTMSVIGTLNVSFNLHAIFCLLPVTRLRIERGQKVVKKGGKIKFPPQFNIPGEILSMSFNKQTRGIIRSDHPVSFPHSIILDVGTSHRVVSVKLSNTMEMTGPTSFEIAREAGNYILDAVGKVQEELDFLKQYPAESRFVAHWYLDFRANGKEWENDVQRKIVSIYDRMTVDYPLEHIPTFLTFLLALDKPIYTGSLKLLNLESAMVNMCYDLGFCIDRSVFHYVMNEKPFVSNYNNAKTSSEARVEYWYDKIDKNTGKTVKSRHTISVKLSGYVNHSGPNLEAIEYVYYLFLQRIVLHLDKIQTYRLQVRKINYIPTPSQEITPDEYQRRIVAQQKLIDSILNGSILTRIQNRPHLNEDPQTTESEVDETCTTDGSNILPNTLLSLQFDYQPIVLSIG